MGHVVLNLSILFIQNNYTVSLILVILKPYKA